MQKAKNQPKIARVFKTLWLRNAAIKAQISDAILFTANNIVMLGQADDLGRGVFKKRLNDNTHRSIILAKGVRHWLLESLLKHMRAYQKRKLSNY